MISKFICAKGTYGCLLGLLLNSCSSSPENASANPSGENNWSGTITFKHTQTSYHAGPSTEFLYHLWHHSFEQSMDATVTNGTGNAKSSVSLLDTSYYRDQTKSPVVEQWQIDQGSAQGSSNTEVSISIDPNTKTYSIEVPIPQTTGNKTRTNLCKGCGQSPDAPATTSMGEDATSIMVENEKLGPNPDILSGEKTERKKIDNGEGEELTTTRWMFTRKNHAE